MQDIITYPLSEKLVKEILQSAKTMLLKDNEIGKKQKKLVDYKIQPVFSNYVTRNVDFRNELNELKEMVVNYANRHKVKRPLNILLAAEPGTGKSFLIKQLSKSIEESKAHQVEYSEFHTPAFQTINDLYDVFHRVQSANLHGKIPFVFYDEVDGLVGGRHILSNFLAPMWDGEYHTGKDSYALGKAIFVFAGSSLLPTPSVKNVLGTAKKNKQSKVNYTEFAEIWKKLVLKQIKGKLEIEKQKDFMDRVDILLCIPPIDELFLGSQLSQELIDISCLLVKKHFEKIEQIELAAIMVIMEILSESASRRPAEKIIFCSRVPNDSLLFSFNMFPTNVCKKFKNNTSVKEMLGTYYKVKIIK